MKKITLFILFSCAVFHAYAQPVRSENVVIVTLDGFRWQEVFTGADSLLSFDSTARYSTKYIAAKFWSATEDDRRKKLLPFFWTELMSNGILIGNRNSGLSVSTANPHWFSYPGYNEIFTGFPDPSITSNAKVPNKNENVFEYLHKLPEFKGKVASFGSWDVFSSILNEKRSGFLVNDGFRNVPGKLNEKQIALNKLQHELPDLFHGGERLDVATFHIGLEYMKANKPKLIHFGFGDTDEFAHAGQYDYYLDAAQKTDAWIGELWKYIQSDPHYANKTTLIITTDHGRGSAKDGAWRDHGSEIPGADAIWIAAIGPSVRPVGKVAVPTQYHQGQIAASIARMFGKEFKSSHPVMPPLPFINK